MRLLAVVCLILIGCALASCEASITVIVPYCPTSDSAKAKADSVPIGCRLVADSVKR